MIRRLACMLVVLGGVAIAQPKRRAVPDKYEKAAGEAFEQAIAADNRGDLEAASKLYLKAFEVAPHGNIAFNLAELEERRGRDREAMAFYELYLYLSPRATDRKEVEARIDDLTVRPRKLVLRPKAGDVNAVDLARAYVLVDGVIVHRPGATQSIEVRAMRGPHVVDVVTAVSFASFDVTVDYKPVTALELVIPPRVDGAVVVSGRTMGVDFDGFAFQDKSVRSAKLKPGTYRAAVDDRGNECPPITLKVPKDANQVAYVFVEPLELRGSPIRFHSPSRCRKHTVHLHTLVFKP